MSVSASQAAASVEGVQMSPILDFTLRTRLVSGPGCLDRLPELVRELSGSRVLLVTDSGLRKAGHIDRAERMLRIAGLEVSTHDKVTENPTTDDVEVCVAAARTFRPDLLIGIGGGSSMDCARGANFLLTNGGQMQDYRGIGKATRPMLPMIAVPTTSGTGSEAQSFAVIADSRTHLKMACGDTKAACRIAVLDPELTITMPRAVTATTGIDAMTHAIESYVTLKRSVVSGMFSATAWSLLVRAFQVVLDNPRHVDARGQMQLGAFFAGAAIENSMLGAAHAAANPLTAHFGLTHGVAVGLMLPHVIRWNSPAVGHLYADLMKEAGWKPQSSAADAGDVLADGFVGLLKMAGLPISISAAVLADVNDQTLQQLAQDAVQQWTGTFNPRKMDVSAFAELYRRAV